MGAGLWKFYVVLVLYMVLQYGDSVWVELLLVSTTILFCFVSIAVTTWQPLAASWHGKRTAKHEISNASSSTIPAARARNSSGVARASMTSMTHPRYAMKDGRQTISPTDDLSNRLPVTPTQTLRICELGHRHRARCVCRTAPELLQARSVVTLARLMNKVATRTQEILYVPDHAFELDLVSAVKIAQRRAARSATVKRAAKYEISNAQSSSTIPAARARNSSGVAMRDARRAVSASEIACGLGHSAFSRSQSEVRSPSWTHTWLEQHVFSQSLTEIGSPHKTWTQDSFCDLQVSPRAARSSRLRAAAIARSSRECSGVAMRDARHAVSAPEIDSPRTAGIPQQNHMPSFIRTEQEDERRLHKSWHGNEASRARSILPQKPTSKQPRNVSGGSRFDARHVERTHAQTPCRDDRQLRKQRLFQTNANASATRPRGGRCPINQTVGENLMHSLSRHAVIAVCA